MEEKITAVYLLVWIHELEPEDGGDFTRALEKQKEECLGFLKKKGLEGGNIVYYQSRSDLFRDVERDKVARLLLHDIGRLGATEGDREGALYELEQRGVELITIEGGTTGEPS